MKKKILDNLVKVEPVKLKSIFGIAPGVYLTVLYTAILLAGVFIIGFLPDIINGYKRVTFVSEISNTAVYVDGQYKGSSPFTTNLKSGNHEVVYKVSDEVIDTQTINVSHPVFFNWLFPRRMKVQSSAGLTSEALEKTSVSFIKDVALWSAQTNFDDVNPYRPVFKSFASTVQNINLESKAYNRASLRDVLELSFSFITSPTMLEDAKEAASMLDFSYDFTIQEALFSENNQYIGSNTPSKTNQKGQGNLSYDKTLIPSTLIEGSTITVGKRTTNSYPEILEASKLLSYEDFYIANSEVTEYQYALFLQENPDWKLSNIEALKEEGLVDDYYLYGISLSSRTNPIRNISYKAAEAYCQWLSSKTGKQVYIPNITEWEAALNSSSETYQNTLGSSSNSSELGSLLGGVWEMTRSKFIPLSRIIDTDETLLASMAPNCDIILKGGSYLNIDVTTSTVGGFACNACSELTGFRVAWR